MKIVVKNCHECPFCNDDSEYGKDRCNLYSNTSVNLETWNQLPKDKVHENCSLLKEDCIITITTD
jgi:hypothetical protein